jgi:hypothetical protein
MSQLEQQAADLQHTAMGQKGAILITDTTAVTGNFKAIMALSDTVFTLLTSDLTKNGVAVAAAAADFGTLSAGMTIYGKFTAITLTSGKVIAYK